MYDYLNGLFPAHAGMNRETVNTLPCYKPVPRTRGDEPYRNTAYRD